MIVNSNVLEVTHNGKSIIWSMTGFNKTPMVARNNGGLEHVNAYLSKLPEKVATSMFDRLQDVREAFDGFGQLETKVKKIKHAVELFVELINPNSILGWLEEQSTITIPSSIKEEYTENDKDPDKTFLKHEYLEIVMIAIVLKLLMGIFGEFLLRMKDILGTNFKEYGAYRLLDNTWIPTSNIVNRIIRYIETWIQSDKKMDSAVMGGISSQELPYLTLAHIFIRKLGPGTLEEKTDNGGIIVNIYRGLTSFLKDISSKFTTITEKSIYISADSKEDNNNWSHLELYMITQPQSIGSLVIHRQFINRTESLAMRMDPTLPLSLLAECIAGIRSIYKYKIETHIVVLVQWTLYKEIPARMYPNLNRDEMLHLIGLTQALLWHWGFYDLALLLTAVIDRNKIVYTHYEGRLGKRVRTDPMMELSKLYPYQRTTSKSKPRDTNLAHQAISQYRENLGYIWLYYRPTPTMEEYANSTMIDERGSLVPDDITSQLAELLIKVGN